MADLFFLTRDIYVVGSAIGFYGSAGFGASVLVGEYQGSTYITSSNGTVQGVAANNNIWRHANSGTGIGADPLNLLSIPNAEATLNIRFTHDTAVNIQNCEARIYDRINIDKAASGVTTKMAEIIHPNTLQVAGGSGDTTWITPAGSAIVVNYVNSPGVSGLHAGNSEPASVRHDFYTAISASPDSIGSKTSYGLFFQVEYL